MPAKIITEIRCSHCDETFMASRQKLYDQRRGISPYCKPECRKAGMKKPAPKPIEGRFLARVRRLTNGCLEWTGPLTKTGYPCTMSVGGIKRAVYHVAWFRHYGEWPTQELDHVCHPNTCTLGVECPHRRCVEWSHLKLSTHKENGSAERSSAGSAATARATARTRCGNGHEYTPENTYRSPDGKRHCKECQRRICRQWQRENRKRQREQKHGREQ